MDKNGQITLGLILTGFIGILVGLILMQGTFPFIGAATNSYTLTNSTFTGGGGGVTTDLVGQELLSTPIVSNQTGQQVVGSGNYTIAERVSTVDGLKRIAYTPTSNGNWNTTAVNISYNYGQEGYIDDAGGRGVTNLIPIVMAIALIAAAVTLAYKKGMFD